MNFHRIFPHLLIGVLLLTSAQAALIIGDARFSGTAALDNLPNDATTISFTTPSDTLVIASNNDLSGLAGQTATFTDFFFGVAETTGGVPVNPLISIPGGWEFNLIGITSNLKIGDHRELKGIGNLTGPAGFDETIAFFDLVTEPVEIGLPPSENIRFSASIVTQVPEPSSTLSLILCAGASLFRRHRK